MQYDFDTVIDRRDRGSLKWEKYRGKDILPLWVADADFRSPPAVIEALRRDVEHGIFGYAIPTGELVEAVVEMLRRRFDWPVEPAWIVWLPGLVPGLNIACRAFGEPGDAVMTPTPIYPPFLSAPVNTKRERIEAPVRLDGNRWVLDRETLERNRTERTRVLLYCNPHNPVGRAYTRDEVREVADFCMEHDLILCSDEIHCDLVLDDRPHTPAAALGPDIADRTVTLLAPSKTYNIPGLGCSFAVISNPRLRAQFQAAMRGLVPDVTLFGLSGCEAAYREGEPWRQALLEYLRANRELVEEKVRSLPGLSMAPVEATYLAWIDATGLSLPDPAAFFEEAGVGLADGRLYRGPGFVRLNFGCPRATLQEALARMESAVLARS